MTDKFASHQSGLDSPATMLATIVPNDTADLSWSTRALAVSASGTIRLTTVDGFDDSIYVVAGAPFPIRARRVWATGTNATGIVALA